MYNNKFELVTSFKIFLPTWQIYSSQLEKFIKTHSVRFGHCNKEINDQNFSKIDHLLLGKEYIAKFWTITQGENATELECQQFFDYNKVISSSIKAMSLAWEQKEESFPVNKYVLSFKESCVYHDDVRRPGIRRHSDTMLDLGLVCFSPSFGDSSAFFGLVTEDVL